MKTAIITAAALILLAACQPHTPTAHDRGAGACVIGHAPAPGQIVCPERRLPEHPRWPITEPPAAQPDQPPRGGNCGRGPNPDRGNVPACPEVRS